jgi:molybdopterin-containing oxidoreductase family membrane subunit
MQSESVGKLNKAEMNDPVIAPGYTYGGITEQVSGIPLAKGFPRWWIIGFAIAFVLLMLMIYAIVTLLVKGVGIWGVTNPSDWGFAIINFVWWIGIGHAGTLISAILLLLHQTWRNSINRFAEAMTLFAVACAGIFPILHLGRPWLFYWLIPYPNTMYMWPQFRSPLAWDVFAVSTYATVSLMFWLIGLVPDFAKMRDSAKDRRVKTLFGILSLGWRGSSIHWHRYEMAYLLLAGLSTPLVLSVHSIVSLDFAAGIVPGWHVTVFPPYFVAGAVFAGFAMVLTLVIPIRKIYKLEGMITMRHIENMCKVMLATGLIVLYGYMLEVFFGWYSANEFEQFMVENRFFGPNAPAYWALIVCNGLAPQLMWFKPLRRNLILVWLLTLVVAVGMWLERYVIVVMSLERDFIPSAWDLYHPTFWDIALYVGTFGLFFSLMFLFIRLLPMINIFEMQVLQYNEDQKSEGKWIHH